mmetsp:Transcript_11491/g.26737  ORF Transcript_11491/g.26737 Transcript_11491/m.26737 type:complete len:413 (+) Transcript_11491:66-1304(+)
MPRDSRGGGVLSTWRYKTLVHSTIADVLRDRPGFKETDAEMDWDILWADVGWIRENFDRYHLEEYQRVNHFRNHAELTRKDLMVKNLKRMRKTLEREDRQVEASKFDFFPATFVLPGDYQLFVEEFKRCQGATWIAKPVGSAQGKGIFLFNKLKDVSDWKNAKYKEGPAKEGGVESYVFSRYIDNPYLIGGKKFDLRLYALVTSYSPLTVWFHRGGFARFSNSRYSTKTTDMTNSYVHLTNVAIQKTAPGYEREVGCKWDVTSLRTFLASRHGVELTNDVFFEIQMLVLRSLFAVQKVMINDKHCFELYGYDILLDDALKPWLLEVNASPSLTADTEADYQFKTAMLDDVLDVIDVEGRRTGAEEGIGGFDLVYNGRLVLPDRGSHVTTFLGCHNCRPKPKSARRRRREPAA